MGKTTRILLFGQTGQVARALIRQAQKDNDVVLTSISRREADFLNPASIPAALNEAGPADIVINAVAYTAVDRAEREREAAFLVNAESVGMMAERCAALGLPLIHLSTDYIFDGAKATPYVESDSPGPLNVYGDSKLAGEEYVRQTLSRHIILRTSWVYSPNGTNFVKTMLRLGVERDALSIVNDQQGAPTAAHQIADALLTIARQAVTAPPAQGHGIFHFTAAGHASWYEFALAIFVRAYGWAGTGAVINPITSRDYPAPARRPLNSQLDCQKIAGIYGIRQEPWESALDQVLRELSMAGTEKI